MWEWGSLTGQIPRLARARADQTEINIRCRARSSKQSTLKSTGHSADYCIPHVQPIDSPDLDAALLAVPAKNHLNWLVKVSGIALAENALLQSEIEQVLSLLQQEISHE